MAKAQYRAPGMGTEDDQLDSALNAIGGPSPQAGAPAGAPVGGSEDDALDAALANVGAPAPAAPAAQDLGAGHAIAQHLFEDIPIAGPAIKSTVDWALAKSMAAMRGTKFEDELAGIEARNKSTEEAHPVATEVGKIGGQALGIAALGAAAPTALGIGMTTGKAAAMSAATMGLVGSIDAAVRGQDPLAGGITSAAGGAVAPYISALFTHGIAPRVAQLYQIARQNRIEIPAGLVSNNPILRWVKGLPGGAGDPGRQAAAQFRQATIREMGATNGSDALTAETMDNARVNNSRLFQSVAQRAPDMRFDQPLHKLFIDLADDIRTPTATSPIWQPGEQQKALQLLGQVALPFQRGNINGAWRIEPQQYLKLTETSSALDKWINSRSSPNVADVAQKLKNGLDDLLERNLPRDAVDTLAQARKQWWAMKTLEPLAEKYRASQGIFQPEDLGPAVAANTKNYAFGGGGNLANLAEIGGTFLKGVANPKQDADTLWRWIQDIGLGVGAGYLHSGLHSAAVPVAAAVSAAGPFAARILGRSTRLTPALVRSATDARALIQAPRYIGRGAAEALGRAGAGPIGDRGAEILRANNPLAASQLPEQ